MDRKLSKHNPEKNVMAFGMSTWTPNVLNIVNPLFSVGFVEKEIKKANIPTVDTGENPEVPFPRDMIDLEVAITWNLWT